MFPTSVAIGDLNGDGRSDLAVANQSSDDVSILLGTGTGTFGAATNFAVGFFPGSVAISDFNGDGRSDLAVANYFSDNVSILLYATAPGMLALSAASFSVSEGAGSVTITVNRTGGTDCSVTVDFATSNGTASAGLDYSATSGTLTFGPGVTSQTFVVPITDDIFDETDETFTVTISNAGGGATLAAPTSATVTITDNDPPPTLVIDNVTQSEGNAGTTNFNFTVTLSPASGMTVMVNFATANGTATAPADFTATSGTLTFPPGVTTQTITILVNGDTVFEPDEAFTVNLSAPTNATILTSTGTGTIVNDDAGNADLGITKTASGGFFATQNATFNIAVTNSGPNNAVAVVVTDVIPAGTTFASATPSQGSCSGTSTVMCNLGTINNGGSASIALTVTLNNAGPVSNTATVSAAPQPDPNPANNTSTATVTVLPAASIPALDEKALTLLAAILATLGALALKKS
jgi:uncharacterized repeat protein (TIGR01451 family)